MKLEQLEGGFWYPAREDIFCFSSESDNIRDIIIGFSHICLGFTINKKYLYYIKGV